MRFPATLAIVLLATPVPSALAGSSPWVEASGARLRLVTADLPDEDGTLRGALEIDLHPGWKTYWRDPGDAGIPPQIDVSASMNVGAAAIEFPTPQRFDDGVSAWAGYSAPVTLAVRFEIPDRAKFSAVEADVFLGVCKEVCVPVQARLSVLPESDPQGDAVVQAAFDDLPAVADKDFRVARMSDKGETLVASALVPDPSKAELFLVSPNGWVLGAPELASEGGTTSFTIPVIERPKDTQPGGATIDYTLVSGGKAVSSSVVME